MANAATAATAAGARMSGLCGWLAQDAGGVTLERMAAPVCRFDRTPLESAVQGRGAVALSGSIDCASLFHEDGLMVALWGSPGQHADLLAQRWRSHGAWACASLAGQFAFAIIDERAGEALLAVDRFATRPLYYQLRGQNLLFATSQDALLRHPLAGHDASPQALYDYLALGSMTGTAWEGQQQLGPGEYVHLRAGRLARQQWWRLRFHEHSVPRKGLGGALDTALGHALGSLQPGVIGNSADAHACAALAAQRGHDGAPVPTYSVVYADTTQRQPPPAVARGHHALVVTPSDLVDAIPKLAAWSDRPCGDSAAVGHYYCASFARAHGTLRLLDTAGAAELFGGGPQAARQRRMARYHAVPAFLRQLLVEPLLMRVKGAALADAARRDVPSCVLHASPFGPAAAARMLAPALLASVDTAAPLATLRQWWWSAQCKSDINRAIALDLRLGLPARLAAGVVGCSLAGVDAAFPFLDPAVVDCAIHLHPGLKHPGRQTPHARALRARAPETARPARAQALPFAAWLQCDATLRALAFDSLADLRRRDLVAGSVIDALLATPKPAYDSAFGALVWQLMMLELWLVHRAQHRVQGTAVARAAPVLACRADDPHPVPYEG